MLLPSPVTARRAAAGETGGQRFRLESCVSLTPHHSELVTAEAAPIPLDDHTVARDIAGAAGRLLLAIRDTTVLRGNTLGAAGDRLANELILRMLAEARPADAILSEESPPDAARLAMRRVWIIDPLDGTREYTEVASARTDWAVHVALAIDGEVAAAAVALPAQGHLFSTGSGTVATPPPAGQMRIVVSRTRPPALAEQVARLLDAQLVPMGSAGAKAMAVLQGEAHAYLHAGGLQQWDSCAPVGVALAAGLRAARIDGNACRYNGADPSLPDLLVCHAACAAPILAAIRKVTGG